VASGVVETSGHFDSCLRIMQKKEKKKRFRQTG